MNTYGSDQPHGKQTQRRMTKTSRENLTAADQVRIEFAECGGFFVRVARGDRVGYICGSDGFILSYPSPGAAERAVKRIRPDITPTLHVQGQGADWTMGGRS
jgi:hypothetical protein